MVLGDYTIEATRAIVEERLREAAHARCVKRVRAGRVSQLVAALITAIVVH